MRFAISMLLLIRVSNQQDSESCTEIAEEPAFGEYYSDIDTNPAEREKIAVNAWDYVRRERLFAEQAPLRIQWNLDLWSKRETLWAEV